MQPLRRFWDHAMPDIAPHNPAVAAPSDAAVVTALGRRSIVLVGMMGAGKSSVGRRLAARLAIPFIDADAKIEEAAQMTIAEIFEKYGEEDFRSAEARVIARLLEGGPQVLATGGGAFVDAGTRAAIRAQGLSFWLKADFDVLLRRVKRRSDRPLLQSGDPAQTLTRLIAERYPVYAEADVTIHSRDVPHEKIVEELLRSLAGRLGLADHDRAAAALGECAP
jgi:shikimate kinase